MSGGGGGYDFGADLEVVAHDSKVGALRDHDPGVLRQVHRYDLRLRRVRPKDLLVFCRPSPRRKVAIRNPKPEIRDPKIGGYVFGLQIKRFRASDIKR